jgi:hypothetical protein
MVENNLLVTQAYRQNPREYQIDEELLVWAIQATLKKLHTI